MPEHEPLPRAGRRRRRHPARRTRRALAVSAAVATVALTGTLWAADALGATNGSSSGNVTSSSGVFTDEAPTSSTYDRSSPSFTPSYSQPDTSSHAS